MNDRTSGKILSVLIFCFMYANIYAQKSQKNIKISIDTKHFFQHIDNFGASDAWSCQFVGNWPAQKKNAIADLLFSSETDGDGNPIGIGLSLWRYNLGAGSSNQKDTGKISDEWRSAPSFTNQSKENFERIQGQNWFLTAAKNRGVHQFLAFYNSPPIEFTITKMGFAQNGHTNIQTSNYPPFVNYTMDAFEKIFNATGVQFDYLSPVNEPQWKWSDNKQEGSPYNNAEIASLVKAFQSGFDSKRIKTKIMISEAAHLKYLGPSRDAPEKDEQLFEFFNKNAENYIANLPLLSQSFSYHSYFTSSPYSKAVELRKKIYQLSQINNVPQLWQSEYCILGDNAGEIKGDGKNIGINEALYLARTIHADLVYANVSAWQWWLAISSNNYKDGLIYVDKEKKDGNFNASKFLWTLGNYSRFISPGSTRFQAVSESEDLLVSGYKNLKGEYVLVFVNLLNQDVHPQIDNPDVQPNQKVKKYTTDDANNLKFSNENLQSIIIPSKSIVTIIAQ